MGKPYRDMSPEEKKKSLRANREWAKRNPDAVKRIQLRHRAKHPFTADKHRLRRYGVTPEQFNDMLIKQCGCCAVCGTNEHGARDWHLDHDHTTGKPRGILCVRCNGGLGQFSDNPVLLQNAIDYLQRAAFENLL